MSFDKSNVEKIARLARLNIEAEDWESYSKDIGDILDFMYVMNSVNTDDIAPLFHPIEILARLRADKITETDQRENFQQQAPSIKDGYYIVPKVIE